MRFEDVFVILDRRQAFTSPEYVLEILLDMYRRGTGPVEHRTRTRARTNTHAHLPLLALWVQESTRSASSAFNG